MKHSFSDLGPLLWAILILLLLGGATPAGSQDLDDCAVLFDSNRIVNADINFIKLCEFYGLRCRQIDLRTSLLTDDLLRDSDGQYLSGIAINALILEQEFPALLDTGELATLKTAVRDGAHLFIPGLAIAETAGMAAIRQLTDDRVTGVLGSLANCNWILSPDHPQITREFTGQTIPFEGLNCVNSPVLNGSVMVLMSTRDKQQPQLEYPVLVAMTCGDGLIFIDGGSQRWSLEDVPVQNLYTPQYFYAIMPSMMFLRFAGGDECWHNDHNYANLTIDDPPLSHMQYGNINFQQLLAEMQTADFCVTIGFEPVQYGTCSDEVMDLFREHAVRYSIVQHGNNHDGFEFFAYDSPGSLAVCLERGWCGFPLRPFIQQDADIVEGASRMAELERLSGIPCGRVMIFPFGISPSATLERLKAYNFSATVNNLAIPIGELPGQNYDFRMRPADMNYSGFASITRRHWRPDQSYLFDFFIDRPVFYYEHHDFFAGGPDAFNNPAAAVNAVSGAVRWRGLDDIIKHLSLEKRCDNGTISVLIFTNDVILNNETATTQVYTVKKEEPLNVPLLALIAGEIPVPYSIIDDTLCFTVSVPPQSSQEIRIRYGSGDKDFAISSADISYDPGTENTLIMTVHNHGTTGGPVPVQISTGLPENGGQSLGLFTIERIEPGDSAVISWPINPSVPDSCELLIRLDPYDIISETNEENNWAILDSFDLIPVGSNDTPCHFDLLVNYPNPFNSETTVTYRLLQETTIRMAIYNLLGQHVITLADGKQPAGTHRLKWTGRNGDESLVASGIYFCALETSGSRAIRKLVLLR